jgi:hypothetical protein
MARPLVFQKSRSSGRQSSIQRPPRRLGLASWWWSVSWPWDPSGRVTTSTPSSTVTGKVRKAQRGPALAGGEVERVEVHLADDDAVVDLAVGDGSAPVGADRGTARSVPSRWKTPPARRAGAGTDRGRKGPSRNTTRCLRRRDDLCRYVSARSDGTCGRSSSGSEVRNCPGDSGSLPCCHGSTWVSTHIPEQSDWLGSAHPPPSTPPSPMGRQFQDPVPFFLHSLPGGQ